MRHMIRLLWLSMVCYGLIACSNESNPPPNITSTIPPATSIIQQITTAPTIPPQSTTTVSEVQSPSDPGSFPLSEAGPYWTGYKRFSFTDENRANRNIKVTIWYPALQTYALDGSPIFPRLPDLNGAPYPLILSSSKVGSVFASHLASYGFVYVGIDGLDTYKWNENLIDQPMDILFALHQVASNPLEGLEGMIDAEHAGVMGYSFDGYNSLALSGARVDPEYYLEFCANPSLEEHWIQWGYCDPANTWDAFSDHAGSAITTSSDGLWQPMTDDRIRAVMPMAPDGAILFGEHGLASVDRPTLIIGATEDDICTYTHEAVYIYENISEAFRIMISFVGKGHMMIYVTSQVTYMKHFATAFFGYHLQGREEFAHYFSEDYVSQFDDLAWGIYNEE